MKRVLCAVLVLSASLVVGCRQPRDGGNEAEKGVEVDSGISTVRGYRSCDTVKIGGSLYTYDILSQACDTLPVVKDEWGETRDNTIRVVLTRNGHTYFDHTFTKQTFKSGMDETFYEGSILDGMCYIGAEAGKGLTFSVAVSEPYSDMSMPFSLTIADDGGFSFFKEEVIDVEQLDE